MWAEITISPFVTVTVGHIDNSGPFYYPFCKTRFYRQRKLQQGVVVKTAAKIIISALVMLAVSSVCLADPPDPKPPELTGTTITAPRQADGRQ